MNSQPYAYQFESMVASSPEHCHNSATSSVAEFIVKQFHAYRDWLLRQPLSIHTRRAYLSRTNQFIRFVMETPEYSQIGANPTSIISAASHYQQTLLSQAPRSPHSINAAVASVESFFKFVGMPALNLDRQSAPLQLPRLLGSDDQVNYLRAVSHHASVKERALIATLFYTGIRVSECAELNLSDLELGPSKGQFVIGGKCARKVPLNSVVRASLREWMVERIRLYSPSLSQALFLNRHGKRISTRGIDYIVRKLGHSARLEVSADILRQTFLVKLAVKCSDAYTVAIVAGYKNARTAQRYCRPDPNIDPWQAMESLIDQNSLF